MPHAWSIPHGTVQNANWTDPFHVQHSMRRRSLDYNLTILMAQWVVKEKKEERECKRGMRIVEALLEPLDGCVGKLAHAKKTQRRTDELVVVMVGKKRTIARHFFVRRLNSNEHIRKYLNVCPRFSGYAWKIFCQLKSFDCQLKLLRREGEK